jgi:hypothetical protein
MRDTLGGYLALFGAEYPDTLACQGVLAKFLWWADHHDESIALYEQTLAACERALGPDDAITKEVAAGLEEVREDVSGDDAG